MFSALIIDGDDEAVAAIRATLESFGFEFNTTDSPVEAMTLARTATPDVIFLRVELPNSSGFSVCNKLRRSDDTRYIPVLMYASGVEESVFDQHRNLKTRADEYLHLPLDSEALLTAIRSLIPLPGEPGAPTAQHDDSDSIDVDLEAVMLQDDDELEAPPSQPQDRSEPQPAIQLDDETDAAFAAMMDDALPRDDDDELPLQQAEAAPEPRLEQPPEPHPAATGAAAYGQTEPEHAAPLELTPEPTPVVEHSSTPPPQPTQATATHLDSSGPSSGPTSGEYIRGRIAVDDEGEPPQDASSSAPDRPGFKAQREVIALKTQLNAKKREILSLRDELESKERAVLDIKSKNRELLTQIGDLEDKLVTAEETVITAQEQAEAAIADKNTVLRREEGIKNRLELAQNKVRDLEQQLERDAERFQQQQQASAHELERVQQELQNALDQAAGHSGELESLRSEMGELRSHSEELEQRWRHASTELESVLKATQGLEQQLEESQQALAEARQQAATELEQRLQEAAERAKQEQDAALGAQGEEHQRELEFQESQSRGQLDKLREELETTRSATHASLERARDELREAQEASQAERERLVQEVAALRAELEGVNIQLNQATQQLTGTQGELDGLRFELDSRRDVERRAQQALAVALRVLDGQATT